MLPKRYRALSTTPEAGITRLVPHGAIAGDAARHRVNKGRDSHLRPRETRPVAPLGGRERGRRGAEPHVVMADLSTSEPLA